MLSIILSYLSFSLFFFFNDTATTEIYTLSLHDALPISRRVACAERRGGRLRGRRRPAPRLRAGARLPASKPQSGRHRSEEHTSELQSLAYLVFRLLLEKKKKKKTKIRTKLRINYYEICD